MKKLIYLDSNSVGNVHEGFNSSSLLMFSYLYDKVTYFSSKSSYESTCSIIGKMPSNIHHKFIFVVNASSVLTSFIHHLVTAIINIMFVICSRRAVLVINFNNLWELPVVNFLLNILNREVIVICHGELEYLSSKIKINKISAKALNWLKNDKTTISNGLYFCVLGSSILENIRKLLPENISSHFLSFNLTFVPSCIDVMNVKGTPCKIGVIGTAHENKGLCDILAFAKELQHYSNFEFYTIGRVLCDTEKLKEKGIKFIEGADKGFVDRATLVSYIQAMDIIVFLHSSDSYKLTASSALMDAIDFEKPILSLHNDFFDYVYKIANYGKLFNNIEEIVDYLQKGDIEKLRIDFKENKKRLSPLTESMEFRKELKNHEVI